jgi:ribosomal protein S6
MHTLRKLEALHKEMRELTLGAGVKPEVYDIFCVIDPGISEEEIQEKWLFLNEVRKTAYQSVLEIWRLLPPEVWQRYKEFLETGLREQRLLKERQKVLRFIWLKYHKEQKDAAKNNKNGDQEPVEAK